MKKHVVALLCLLALLMVGCMVSASADPYASTLDKWYNALSAGYDEGTLSNLGISPLAKEASSAPLYSTGYVIQDLDGDGQTELMFGSLVNGSYYGKMIFALYRYTNAGGVEEVFMSTERNRYYYCGGNTFENVGSSGYSSSVDTAVQYSYGSLINLGTTIPSTSYVQAGMNILAGTTPVVTPVPTYSPVSYTYYVNGQTSDRVHLRSYASTGSASKGLYFTGTPVQVISVSGDWSYVQIGTQTGYMLSRFLTTASVTSLCPTGYAMGNQYVNLRANPSTSASVLKRVTSGSWVQIYGETVDHWYYLRTYDGTTGYAMASLIRMN